MASAQGLILYVHGARDPRWAEPFLRLREKVAARVPGPVVLAFLEHGTPTLAAAAAALASQGVTTVRVVPLFFGRGGHLREDMPKQLVAAQVAAPGVTFDVTEAAGENESVLEALASFALGGR
jgi:sirohydrochlorin cobaltochelatase